MTEDRRVRQLARLEETRRRTEERFAAQRKRVDERYARARHRIMTNENDLSKDQQRIIATALELLDEVGLQELSLRKLAGKLELQAPALYWHFKNKEALTDHMAEAILKAEFAELRPREDTEAWQDWLLQTCCRLRNAMCARRDGARVVAGAHVYPAVTLMSLFEVSMQSLISAGVEPQRANLIIMTAIHFVFGNVIEEQASPSLEEIESINLNEVAIDYPLVAESIMQSIKAAKAGYDEFEDALRLIIGPKP